MRAGSHRLSAIYYTQQDTNCRNTGLCVLDIFTNIRIATFHFVNFFLHDGFTNAVSSMFDVLHFMQFCTVNFCLF